MQASYGLARTCVILNPRLNGVVLNPAPGRQPVSSGTCLSPAPSPDRGPGPSSAPSFVPSTVISSHKDEDSPPDQPPAPPPSRVRPCSRDHQASSPSRRVTPGPIGPAAGRSAPALAGRTDCNNPPRSSNAPNCAAGRQLVHEQLTLRRQEELHRQHAHCPQRPAIPSARPRAFWLTIGPIGAGLTVESRICRS